MKIEIAKIDTSVALGSIHHGRTFIPVDGGNLFIRIDRNFEDQDADSIPVVRLSDGIGFGLTPDRRVYEIKTKVINDKD